MSGRPKNGGSTGRGGRTNNSSSSRGRLPTNSGRGSGPVGRHGQSAGLGSTDNLRGGDSANNTTPRVSRQDIELVAQHSKL